MQSIAHIREYDKKIQTVSEHLLGVKILAENYGEKIGLKHVVGLAGVLHDLGKYTEKFRNYIWDAVHYPEIAEKRGKIDHSTAGGRLLYNMYHDNTTDPFKKILAEIVGNAIISHHAYLQDFITPELNSKYLFRVQEKDICEFEKSKECFFRYVMTEVEFDKYVNNALDELKTIMDRTPTQVIFLTKYIFSGLIDADRTNTREFEDNKENKVYFDHLCLFQSYYKKLIDKYETFNRSATSDHPINKLRAGMAERCDKFAEEPSGIYTLSIPTGGGKTLASLRYALKHAQMHPKQRIIYIVPFTTIIEQNAKEVRDILKDDRHILEHHSNIVIDEDKNNDGNEEEQEGLFNTKEKIKLARDDWDSPLIFTTMVQFLNVFYSKGTRNIRRLHNLSHSVLIFDEVQKVPVQCVSLFNEALNFLRKDAHCSIVFCTATQPALEFVDHKLEINADGEIIEQVDRVNDAFKRVEIIDETSYPMTTDYLGNWINKKTLEDKQSILIILNTKAVVKDLYVRLKNDDSFSLPVYHLSTSMCPAHRNRILREMKDLLKAKIPFVCVTTQLIEAGVNVSFSCVVRSLAGLDSIAQAGGRCNRHGEYEELKYVYVIDHLEEKLDKLKEIKEGKILTKQILADLSANPKAHGGGLLSREAMTLYFRRFYTVKFKEVLNYPITDLGDKDMTDLLFNSYRNGYAQDYKKENEGLELLNTSSYKTAADYFRVINDITQPAIVPYGDGKELINKLNSAARVEELTELLRKAQQYTINLYPNEVNELSSEGGLEIHLDGQVIELKERWYSKEHGLDMEGEGELGLALV
ncbi:CRISPR-associated helicase Cas3' [Salicibibacter cibarius]|uniref:CRISPR-associated helicase Cas3 n=1 Tax=Salicibibacter cibarius TaxID=2743000 RepID=A0A7T7CAE8_9BACI|nr:CRISPR-associated helicase Cas3' [Salicibibacter cibarius]QQK74819.1 CRISPR-associated helicase Cas3' [Salicibibacter cibarius]